MSTDQHGVRGCDGCYRVCTPKRRIIRIHQGREYCAACYKRLFIRVSCTTCPGTARWHIDSKAPARCPACTRRTRTCLRCGMPAPNAGLVLPIGVVCPSCTIYYQPLRACPRCHRDVPCLSRVPEFGITEPICNGCRARLTHRTCMRCRRYRRVVGVTADEKPYCADCTPGQEVSHPCPGCRASLPGSGTGSCLPCLNLSGLARDAEIHGALLSQDWTRTALRQFASWLVARRPTCTVLQTHFVRHVAFFERIDHLFPTQNSLTGPALLAATSVAELRRHLLVTRFLQEIFHIELAPTAKNDRAEADRIAEKMLTQKLQPWGPLLERYLIWLEETGTAVRTRRLYLRSSELFCAFAKLTPDAAWSPTTLEAFLRRRVGARASLFRFVTFCQIRNGWEVAMPHRPDAVRQAKPPRTIAQLRALLAAVANVGGPDQAPTLLLARLLAKTLGFTVARFQSEMWKAQDDKNGMSLVSHEHLLRIPEDLQPHARALIAQSHAAMHDHRHTIRPIGILPP